MATLFLDARGGVNGGASTKESSGIPMYIYLYYPKQDEQDNMKKCGVIVILMVVNLTTYGINSNPNEGKHFNRIFSFLI